MPRKTPVRKFSKDDYTPPSRIEFFSDNSVAEYSHTIARSTHRSFNMYVYKWVVSYYIKDGEKRDGNKLGREVPYTKEDIEKLKKQMYCKVYV